jgi:hypothetical protein
MNELMNEWMNDWMSVCWFSLVSACSTTIQLLLAQWDSCQFGILW